MKELLTSLHFLISIIYYSQDLSNINFESHKLKFNSSLSEISADVVDGKLMYFKNKKAINKNSQYYDLFMLDSSELNLKFGDKKRISLTKQLTIVTDYHEGPCFVDEINNKIYITVSSLDRKGMKRNNKLNTLKENRLRLLEGDFKDGIISNLKEFPYNNPIYNIGHATYSEATKRLYFVSTMPGTLGGNDIFYSSRKVDGSWDTPKNLGRRINSKESDLFPYIKDGILFFASNGQKKQIGNDLDLFFIKESDLTDGRPTELVGANTNYDDFAICFNNSKESFEGYFTSNRENTFSGNDDVYSFKISNIKYENTYDLLVKLTSDGEYIKTGVTSIIDFKGNVIGIDSCDNNEFNYDKLIKGEKYQLTFENNEYSRLFELPTNFHSGFVSEVFDIKKDAIFKDTMVVDPINVLVDKLNPKEKVIANVDSLVAVSPTIKEVDPAAFILDTAILTTVIAKKEEVKLIVKKEETIKFDRKESFKNIYFTFDSYVVSDFYKKRLDNLISYAKGSNAKFIVLNAYTDSRGNKTYNEKLSVKRALATREYLIKNGIAESQIKYQGFGENNLVNRCGNGIKCTDLQHLENRRIEFTLAY